MTVKVVIKIGGTLLEDAAAREHMAQQLRQAVGHGREVLVIHGGGKQLTSFLERIGVRSEFINGLRVTSPEALDGVVKVFAGTVNHSLLAALYTAGVSAVGISGIDGGCLLAKRLRGANGEDWGYVGRITRVKPRVWEALLAGGLLPVMAPIAVGEDGQIYNINADQAAVACAAHWHAESLIFLTDVDGVHDLKGKIVPRLTAEEIPLLLRSGVVTGGMLAKLHAVEEALAAGIPKIVIRNGHSDGALESVWDGTVKGTPPGTVIVSSLAAAKKI